MSDLVNILYLEDNKGDVRLLKLALAKADFHPHVDVVEDGISALEFLRKQGRYARSPSPDLILLDLNVPKRSGSSVLQELRKDHQYQNTPVFILTSTDSPRDKEKCLSLGADRFIVKPTDFDELVKFAAELKSLLFKEMLIS
jgi:DNA-binding response OmpR family regulator